MNPPPPFASLPFPLRTPLVHSALARGRGRAVRSGVARGGASGAVRSRGLGARRGSGGGGKEEELRAEAARVAEAARSRPGRNDAAGAPTKETLANGGGGGDAAGDEEYGPAVGARGWRPRSQALRQRCHGLQGGDVKDVDLNLSYHEEREHQRSA